MDRREQTQALYYLADASKRLARLAEQMDMAPPESLSDKRLLLIGHSIYVAAMRLERLINGQNRGHLPG